MKLNIRAILVLSLAGFTLSVGNRTLRAAYGLAATPSQGPSAQHPRAAKEPVLPYHTKLTEAPAWTVPYGREFWRDSANGPQPGGIGVTPGSASTRSTFNLSDVRERIAHSFLWHADESRAVVSAKNYAVEMDGQSIRFSPFLRGTTKPDPAAAATLRVLALKRGQKQLYEETEGTAAWSVLGNTVQGLLNKDQGFIMHSEARSEGLELSWILKQAPPGSGDLDIALGIEGASYAGATARGHHYVVGQGRSRLCVGETWVVDAGGNKTEAVITADAGHVHVRIAAATLAESRYPLAIDPLISPEFELNQSVRSERTGLQYASAIGSDGDGYLVTWQDYSAGPWSVYGVRVDASGQVLDPLGFQISPAPGYNGQSHIISPDQIIPAVAWDGQNYLVLWEEPRNIWTHAVYGARVSPAGQVLDPEPIVISRGPLGEAGDSFGGFFLRPAVAWNGQTYLAAWEDPNQGITGARVSSAGVVLDPTGIPINSGSEKHWPAVTWNGLDFLVVWEDARKIYGARVNPEGEVLDPGGIPISTVTIDNSGAGVQFRPAVSSDGQGSLVVWWDTRDAVVYNSYGLIYGARVNSEGRVQEPDGFAIGTTTSLGYDPAVAWDGENYLVVWSTGQNTVVVDYRSDVYRVWGTRVSPGGQVLDPAGIAISPVTESGFAPAVASNGHNCLVSWEGYIASGFPHINPVHCTRVSANGQLEDNRVTFMSRTLNSQVSPAVASNGANYLVVWADDRSGIGAIYGARVQSDGQVLDPTGIQISDMGLSSDNPAIASDGQNFLVAWYASDDWTDFVYGTLVGGDGRVLTPEATLIANEGTFGLESPPQVAWGSGNYFVVWGSIGGLRSIGGPSRNAIGGVRVSAEGLIQDSNEIPISVAQGGGPLSVAANDQGYLVAWHNVDRVLTVHLTPAGEVGDVVPVNPVGPVNMGNPDLFGVTVASDGERYLVAWTASQAPPYELHVARMNPVGQMQSSTVVDSDSTPQFHPAMEWDGRNYILLWSSQAGAVRRIYGLQLNAVGEAQTPAPFAVTSLPPGRYEGAGIQSSALASAAPGLSLVTYSIFDSGLNIDRVEARILQAAAEDLNGDGCVDRNDLNLLMQQIRVHSTNLAYDLNGDGKVDIADARALVLHFSNADGTPCPPL